MTTYKTINDLAASTVGGADEIEVSQAGSSRSITVGQLAVFAASSSATYVSVAQFGAKGDGVSDDTAAIQAALNTGHAIFLPKGRYLITNMLTVPYGSGIFGETKNFSKLIVPTSFNLAAMGVIHIAAEPGTFGGNEQAGTIKDIAIEFDQPDTAVRASLVQYPPAIYATSSGRFVIQNIRIVRGWKGLWMPGNSGGAMVDNFEASCFNQSVWMDDIFDVVHFSCLHLWAFGLTANQLTAFSDGNTIGLEAGRVDTLHLQDFFAINISKGIWLHTGATNPPANVSFGQLTNIMLDNAGMVIENGTWNITNLYLTPGNYAARCLIVTADNTLSTWVNVSNLFLRILSLPATTECIHVAGNIGSAELSIVGMTSIGFAFDVTHIGVDNGSQPARLNLTNAYLFRAGNTAYTKPTIDIRSGRASLDNISTADKGTGAGDLVKVGADDWITIKNITSVGWGISVPANATYIESDLFGLRQTYTPVVTAQTGTLTSYTATGRYTRSGKFLKLQILINITTNGTAAGFLVATFPTGFTAASRQIIAGQVNGGNMLYGVTDPTQTFVIILTSTGVYPGSNGAQLVVNGEIEVQ